MICCPAQHQNVVTDFNYKDSTETEHTETTELQENTFISIIIIMLQSNHRHTCLKASMAVQKHRRAIAFFTEIFGRFAPSWKQGGFSTDPVQVNFFLVGSPRGFIRFERKWR